MVVLRECKKMFWGITLDGGKRYTQTVERSFNITMAAIEPPSPSGKLTPVSVMVQIEKAEFLLCTLGYGNLLQQKLDLLFTEGEEVTFFLNGSGVVHLTGFLVEDQMENPYLDDLGSESDSEEAPELVEEDDSDLESEEESPKSGQKRKLKAQTHGKKKIKTIGDIDEGDDDDDEDDDDFEIQEFDEDSDDSEDEDDFLDTEALEDDEFDDEEEEEEELNISSKAQQSNKKKKKKEKQKQAKPGESGDNKKAKAELSTPVSQAEGTEGKKKKKKKKKNKDKLEETSQQATEKAPMQTGTPKKRVLAGGLVCEEVKGGHGPEAKPGKVVSVYYIGRLANNGKQFDSCQGGKPFKFRLGKNEVIKGWDQGLQGMKVGGKRRLTIPAHLGYGNQRQGPIPPNSNLVFDVELKAVS